MSWARDVWPIERARLMAAAMKPIERLAAEATVEIVELEKWFDDDVKCESPHQHSSCSAEVTHRSRACITRWRNICQSAADANTLRIASGSYVCAGCGKPAAVCWEQVPI